MRTVLDIGNTRVKYGVFDGEKLIESGIVEDVKKYPDAFVLTPQTPVPLKNIYPTMGLDRIAGCVGAMALWPDTEAFVVDFGTAITFDRVSKEGEFVGGAISPGLAMRRKSLYDLINPQSNESKEAIERGVVEGIVHEVAGWLATLPTDTTVIFTGGDAEMFAKRIKNTIFVTPELVLVGLNRIAAYASSQDRL